MIVNIRGTSGSGKSSVVRAMMGYALTTQTLYDAQGKVTGYECKYAKGIGTVRYVGRYETACGGCDTIKTQDEVENRVRDWHSENYHVVFEGLLISTIYARWAQLARDCQPFKFVFLDASIELCIYRVKQRRKAAGNEKEFNTRNTENKWLTIRELKRKLLLDPTMNVVELPAESAAATILVGMG